MNSFDVRMFAIRRRPGRKIFEVHWPVAGRDRSRSFPSRALAGSYRAELVRAARKGLAFTRPPRSLSRGAAPEPEPVTWYQHAVAYAEMKDALDAGTGITFATRRESERLYAPSAPPQTLSAICT
jgi:hypothetical protein